MVEVALLWLLLAALAMTFVFGCKAARENEEAMETAERQLDEIEGRKDGDPKGW